MKFTWNVIVLTYLSLFVFNDLYHVVLFWIDFLDTKKFADLKQNNTKKNKTVWNTFIFYSENDV